MTPGYIYVLQNELFGPYVVKIGFTTLEPDTRALQLYTGSSGVPTPFDIVTAYSVGDCKHAETIIHKRLKAFRLNGRREFFRISPSVAATLVYETCENINENLGVSAPKPYVIKVRTPNNKYSKINSIERRIATPHDSQTPIKIDRRLIKSGLAGTSKLTLEQTDRVKIIAMLLSGIFPSKVEKWLEDFTKDHNPEREICIWEHITKAYLTVDEIEVASEELKAEAFSLLIRRSISPTAEVLEEARLEHFTRRSAKKLLQAYELKPKPLIVTKRAPSII